MELVSLLRSLGGLGIVLGLLAAALWAVRRYDIALPGRVGVKTSRRLELVERVQLDSRRSVILVRRDDREHLFVLMPDRATVLETRILRDDECAQALESNPRDMVLCATLEEEWYRG
ncbi:flagellar biosynthetic protein FliO [Sphingomonas sp.]|jgi:flagellar protein FliO/FliZ|uniref:flagellar biosynthetic protein FliO n=1 Tax=Sphingomonas sp. TaxID=28214 RepID=UPI002EDB0547